MHEFLPDESELVDDEWKQTARHQKLLGSKGSIYVGHLEAHW